MTVLAQSKSILELTTSTGVSPDLRTQGQAEANPAVTEQELKTISSNDIRNMVRTVTHVLSEGGPDALFAMMDRDGDGLVSKGEVSTFLGDKCGIRFLANDAATNALTDILKIVEKNCGNNDLNNDGILDTKRDGQWSKAELRIALANMSVMNSMLQSPDASGDLPREQFKYNPDTDGAKALALIAKAWLGSFLKERQAQGSSDPAADYAKLDAAIRAAIEQALREQQQSAASRTD